MHNTFYMCVKAARLTYNFILLTKQKREGAMT